MTSRRLSAWLVVTLIAPCSWAQTASSGPPREQGCPDGLAPIDAAHHCCSPGQRWVQGSCAGAITTCAPGLTPSQGRCVPRACEDHRERSADGVHCCWPGQRWDAAEDRCRGESVHCPEGTAALGQHDCAPAIALVVARGHPAAPSGMVWIPGGTFRMGRGPRYTTVGAFFVDRTEVTASNYRRCVAAHVCPASTEAVPSASNDQPMANVSWHSAVTFCAWAGGRLPTEAEWELAARGVDGREEPWGEQRADCHLAQMQGCGDATVRVGSIRAGASPFSVLDLAGNVAEWTLDRWGEVLPAGSVRDPSGPREGDLRVVRGGSFVSDSDDVRATAREGVHPDEARFDVGFRCVRSAP